MLQNHGDFYFPTLLSSATPVITYEYPFNERIRTLLRLEDLFEKVTYFADMQGAREHHVALITIFEILEVASRVDLKMDLIQELERQRQTLLAYRNNPEISEEALSGVLYDLEQASAGLFSISGKVGQHLRENEWLMAIKSRAAIPGGVCEFDLPGYHHWLHQSVEMRHQALMTWLKPFLPLRDGLSIILGILRSSGSAEPQLARSGGFQKMLGGNSSQMVQIIMPIQEASVPEVSANKYALNIRFMRAECDHRPRQCDTDVAFDLVFCNI